MFSVSTYLENTKQMRGATPFYKMDDFFLSSHLDAIGDQHDIYYLSFAKIYWVCLVYWVLYLHTVLRVKYIIAIVNEWRSSISNHLCLVVSLSLCIYIYTECVRNVSIYSIYKYVPFVRIGNGMCIYTINMNNCISSYRT